MVRGWRCSTGNLRKAAQNLLPVFFGIFDRNLDVLHVRVGLGVLHVHMACLFNIRLDMDFSRVPISIRERLQIGGRRSADIRDLIRGDTAIQGGRGMHGGY